MLYDCGTAVVIRVCWRKGLGMAWAFEAGSRCGGGRRDGGRRKEVLDGGVLKLVVATEVLPGVSVGAGVLLVGVPMWVAPWVRVCAT